MLSQRVMFFIGVLVSLLLVGASLYIQQEFGEVLSLALVVQKLNLLLIGFFLLLATIHNPRSWGSRVYGLIVLILSLAGTVLAVRLLWLQKKGAPSDSGQCLTDLGELMVDWDIVATMDRLIVQGHQCVAPWVIIDDLDILDLSVMIFLFYLVISVLLLLTNAFRRPNSRNNNAESNVSNYRHI